MEKWEKIKQQWKAKDEKDRLSKLYNIQIPLEKYGKHYLIKARINDSIKLNLILDTGASSVSVTSSIMGKYDFHIAKRNVSTSTGNGIAKKHIYLVDKFSIEDVDLYDFNVGELRNYKSNKDGLLGMSFLEKFNWEIDEENNILFLNKK